MAVRTKRLWDPTQVSTSNLILYTGPAGETTILKHLSVTNIVGSLSNVRLRLNGTSQSANIMDFNQASTSGQQFTGLFIVLQPGDVLRAIASVVDSVIITGYGTQLEGVAD